MSDTENQTVRGKALREFNDAGTERNFPAGSEHDFTTGEFTNFQLAGLVEAVSADPAEPAKTSRTRS